VTGVGDLLLPAVKRLRASAPHAFITFGGVLVFAYLAFAIASLFVDADRSVLTDRLLPPVWLGGDESHLLGTDSLGRDIAARVMAGARASLAVGVLTVALSAFVGTILGLLAGWRASWLDSVLGRLADFLLAFPMLIFAIGVMSIVGSGFWVVIFALSFQLWVEFYRLVRGEVLAQRNLDYVDAARAIGRSGSAILFDEILPNIAHTIFVLATLRVGYVIIMEASLSFLGLGIQPPVPTWGSMIADGRNLMLSAWWVATMPGIAILGLVLGLNILGDGLRDMLDPRRATSRM
jgi:peptide/nickel transport system permease protein